LPWNPSARPSRVRTASTAPTRSAYRAGAPPGSERHGVDHVAVEDRQRVPVVDVADRVERRREPHPVDVRARHGREAAAAGGEPGAELVGRGDARGGPAPRAADRSRPRCREGHHLLPIVAPGERSRGLGDRGADASDVTVTDAAMPGGLALQRDAELLGGGAEGELDREVAGSRARSRAARRDRRSSPTNAKRPLGVRPSSRGGRRTRGPSRPGGPRRCGRRRPGRGGRSSALLLRGGRGPGGRGRDPERHEKDGDPPVARFYCAGRCVEWPRRDGLPGPGPGGASPAELPPTPPWCAPGRAVGPSPARPATQYASSVPAASRRPGSAFSATWGSGPENVTRPDRGACPIHGHQGRRDSPRGYGRLAVIWSASLRRLRASLSRPAARTPV
jgi:hypothetical protein